MKKVIYIIFVFMLSACSTLVSNISVVSTKDVNLEDVDISKLTKKPVVGKNKKMSILFILTGIPRIEKAVDDALAKGEGDLMIDASLYYKTWWFIIGQYGFEIKGTVVNTKEEIQK